MFYREASRKVGTVSTHYSMDGLLWQREVAITGLAGMGSSLNGENLLTEVDHPDLEG